MPFMLPIYVDYRTKMGLDRRLMRELGVELNREQLAAFISFVTAYTFDSLEWYGRVRRIDLKDLWKAFIREMRAKGKYDTLTSPDVSEVRKKGQF